MLLAAEALVFLIPVPAVEVIFFDKTEAVLSSKLHTVTYVDKKGQAANGGRGGPTDQS